MPHQFKCGQGYRIQDQRGEWIVEAVFKGHGVILADDQTAKPTMLGIVHLKNFTLGYRLIARIDDKRLDRLEQI